MPRTSNLFYPLCEELLRQSEWQSKRDIADAVGAGRSTTQPWVEHLIHHHCLTRSGTTWHTNPSRILHLLAHHRASAIRPLRPITSTVSAQALADLLDDSGVPHVFGFQSAAALYLDMEWTNTLHIYIQAEDAAEITNLAQETTQSNQSAHSLRLYAESPQTIPHVERRGRPVTAVPFTIADLRSHVEGAPLALQLEQELLAAYLRLPIRPASILARRQGN